MTPADSEQTTLFVIDLPRSGSDGVRVALQKRFESTELVWVYESTKLPDAMSVDAFQRLPQERKDGIRAVMGHFTYGIHQRPGPWFTYVAMVRDPIDRVRRLHRDYLELASVGRQSAQRDPMSLEDFVFGQQHLSVDNGYVRAIAGRRHVRFGQCPDDLYDDALEHIDRRFSALLLADEPARSAQIVARVIGAPEVPGMDVAEPGPNEAVDPAVIERIRALNRLDERLVEVARERFDETHARLAG